MVIILLFIIVFNPLIFRGEFDGCLRVKMT